MSVVALCASRKVRPVRNREIRINCDNVILQVGLIDTADRSASVTLCNGSKSVCWYGGIWLSTSPKIRTCVERRRGQGDKGARCGKRTISPVASDFRWQHVMPVGCSTSQRWSAEEGGFKRLREYRRSARTTLPGRTIG